MALLKGDRFIAKVKLTVYQDKDCLKIVLPIPPGPNGYKKSWQYPNIKETGAEVGTYTGNFSDVAYEVDYIYQWRVTKQGLLGTNYDAIQPIKVWVRKSEVTGNWDTGVDAPKDQVIETPLSLSTPDNTNLFLGIGVAAATFMKFILPRIKGK
jgi:hypothetical protein